MPVVRIIRDGLKAVGVTIDGREIQATAVSVDYHSDRLTRVAIEIETTDFDFVAKEAQAVIV
jgi:hypothetical protein